MHPIERWGCLRTLSLEGRRATDKGGYLPNLSWEGQVGGKHPNDKWGCARHCGCNMVQREAA